MEGKIVKLYGRDYFTYHDGRRMRYTGKAKVKLDNGEIVDIPVAMIGVNDDFMNMTSAQMRKQMKKPYQGHKVGERVYISNQEGD